MYCRNNEGSQCQKLESGKLVEVVSDMNSDHFCNENTDRLLVNITELVSMNCILNGGAILSSSSPLSSPEKSILVNSDCNNVSSYADEHHVLHRLIWNY